MTSLWDQAKDMTLGDIEGRISAAKRVLENTSSSQGDRLSATTIIKQWEPILKKRQKEEDTIMDTESRAGELLVDIKEKDKKNTEGRSLEGVEFEVYVAKKYLNLKKSAESRGKEFNLNLGDVRKLLKRKRCAYTGVPLTHVEGKDTDISVDRVNASGGYVKDNVVACSHFANQLKSVLLENNNEEYNSAYVGMKKLSTFIKNCEKLGVE